MVRIKHNPQAAALRKALDSIAFAMAAHGIYVNEYKPLGGQRGVEYIAGFGQDGVVVANWDKDARDHADFKWLSASGLTAAQTGLIEAHSSLFATL